MDEVNLKENPLLKQEDYRAEYNESIEALKNRPELLMFDKLCYEIFEGTENGRKFMEYVTENYLIPPLANREEVNFPTKAVWAEGFKDFPRMIRSALKAHDQRIKAEVNK